jgi:hypothetical protein
MREGKGEIERKIERELKEERKGKGKLRGEGTVNTCPDERSTDVICFAELVLPEIGNFAQQRNKQSRIYSYVHSPLTQR